MRADLAEIAALKKEVARVRAERDMPRRRRLLFRARLRLIAPLLRAISRMDIRFAFISKNRVIWPVSWLCDVLDVSRSGFHAWLNRPTSTDEIHDAKLVTAIETSFKASDLATRQGRRAASSFGPGLAIHQ